MFIATLLTNPDRPVLDRVTVESLRNAWGGGDAIWLEPGVAAEFPVEAMPANRWDVWQGLQGIGVDLVVQAALGRRKKLLIADMDSTMIQQECIDELADEAGVGAHVAGITARAMNGELDFEDALRERVGLLAGLPETVIARCDPRPDHPDAGGAGVAGDDEGERGLCGAGLGRVHGVYRGDCGAAGV